MKSLDSLGQRGERAAINYLSKQGWRIVDHNFRLGSKEIDLIASKNKVIALFEIKTRSELTSNYPIGSKQQKTLKQAHLEYCELNCLNPSAVAYHLLLINYYNGRADLEYYPNFL